MKWPQAVNDVVSGPCALGAHSPLTGVKLGQGPQFFGFHFAAYENDPGSGISRIPWNIPDSGLAPLRTTGVVHKFDGC